MASVTVGTTPGLVDLVAKRGDTVGPIEFAATGVDLSGRTWAAQIRATLDEPATVVATFTVDTTNAASGVLRLTLSATESAKLVTGDAAGFKSGQATYYWDLQATQAGVVKTWFAGKVKVTGDVTS